MEPTPERRKESTKSPMKPPNNGGSGARKKEKQDEQRSTSQQFSNLKKNLSTMVANIQTTVEARALQRMTESDKVHKTRQQLLKDHFSSIKDELEEISKGWHSAKEIVNPQEVQAVLIHQKQLCDKIIADKAQIIDELQQELKDRDESFMNDVKKQSEEIQLILEKMKEQDDTMTEAYRKELEKWREIVQKEEETERTEGRFEWKKRIKKLLDAEVEMLTKRQEAAEEYNFQTIFEDDEQGLLPKSHEKNKPPNSLAEKMKEEDMSIALKAESRALKQKIARARSELKKLTVQKKDVKKRSDQLQQKLLQKLNRKAQDYERLEKKIHHRALADSIRFESMFLMFDAEVKELVDRALYIDSMICKEVLHLPLEPPRLSPVHPGLRRERRAAAQAMLSNREGGFESGLGRTAEDSHVVTPRTTKRLLDLLCDQAGFLFEVVLKNTTDTSDQEERALYKRGLLFNSLGIENKDVPKLAEFLHKYRQESPMRSEGIAAPGPGRSSDDAEAVLDASDSSDFDRNDILEALKGFMDSKHKNSNTNVTKLWEVQRVEAYHLSEMAAYWEEVGNVITPDQLQVWEGTIESLKQHQAVLSEIAELSRSIQRLQQENTELQMVCMLQQ